jgi:hypothetical protein
MNTNPMLAIAAAGAGVIALAAPDASTAAQSASRSMAIPLTGAAEGPGLGDPDGSGSAELRIDAAQGQFCYVLTVANIAPARLAHIHKSPVGEAGGPIVVTLQPPTGGRSEGCTAISPALARSLLDSPADYYVNVHNPEHPGGAVRGQLG